MPASLSNNVLTPRLAALALAVASLPAFAQTAPATLPAASPSFIPAPAAPAAPPASAPAPAAAAELPAVTQPFVATVTADKVYVRSGPGTAYYEMGQLSKNDLVMVTGTSKGWYKILPPNGTFCLIAKEFVDADAAATTGTVKADYVNVRAGTAISPNRDPFAVLAIVRKGAKLHILGSSDKYFQIAPPDNATVFVSPQFVKQTSATYVIPTLKLPAGAAGPSPNTVTSVPALTPTTLPSASIELPTTPTTPVTPAASSDTSAAPATQPTATVPLPVPAVTFSQSATQKFNELNTRYQEEVRKPLQKQEVDPLIAEYKALLAMENIAPSVKLGATSRLNALEKVSAIQKLSRDTVTSDESLTQQRQALQQQYAAAEAAIADYQKTSPFIAEGTLQTSTIVQGKYTLVNPATGRVVAYVDPASEVDIGTLMNKYIGVRGTTTKSGDLTIIKVSNATLLPSPKK